jgi:hypothetical protein
MTRVTSYVKSSDAYSSAQANNTKIVSLRELKVGFLVIELVYIIGQIRSFIHMNINYELS